MKTTLLLLFISIFSSVAHSQDATNTAALSQSLEKATVLYTYQDTLTLLA